MIHINPITRQSSIFNQTADDVFSKLSEELIERIFSFFNREDRKIGSLVNKQWKRILCHSMFNFENAVWRSAEGFMTITKVFGHVIQKLDFTQHKKLTDEGLIDCLNSSRNLEILILKDCEKLTNAGFQSIACVLKNLRVLDFSNCQIEDTGLKELMQHCPKLGKVNLSCCKKITAEGLKTFAPALAHVTELNLSCCKVTDENLTTMAPFLTNLRKLDLSGLNISGSSFKTLSFYCQKIEYLNLDSCEELSDIELEDLIPSLKNLKVLNLRTCNIKGKCFDAMGKNCHQLEELIIGGLKDSREIDFTDDDLMKLAPALINIKVFEFHSGSFTGSCFPTLFQHSFEIEKLMFRNCANLTDTNLALLAPHLKNLKELTFDHVFITGSCFKAMSPCCQIIEKLSFDYCKNLRDKHLADLVPALLNLKEISIKNCFISGSCFTNFYSYSLEKVVLTGSYKLRDEYLEALAPSMKKLKELQIVGCRTITGSCFSSFAGYSKKLEKIDLSGCVNISDKNLANLALENLSELKLEHCENLTGSSFKVFALNSPNLKWVRIATCESVQQRYLMEILTLIKNYSNYEKMVTQIKHVFKLFFSSKYFSSIIVNIDEVGWFRPIDVKMEEYIQKHLQALVSETSSDEGSLKRYKVEACDDT